jgi:hypothetical protein
VAEEDHVVGDAFIGNHRDVAEFRFQFGQLPLDGAMTVGQAARQDPAVERAVEQAVRRAKVYKIDYRADGGANIKVSLDARDLWDELRRVP